MCYTDIFVPHKEKGTFLGRSRCFLPHCTITRLLDLRILLVHKSTRHCAWVEWASETECATWMVNEWILFLQCFTLLACLQFTRMLLLLVWSSVSLQVNSNTNMIFPQGHTSQWRRRVAGIYSRSDKPTICRSPNNNNNILDVYIYLYMRYVG